MSSFHSWLPVALPADARRIRVNDPDLAHLLADAGAEIVVGDADVEIGMRLSDIAGDAPHAIVLLGSNQPDGGSRLLRARRRVVASGGVRLRAAVLSKWLRVRGYRDVSTLLWDYDQPVQLPGVENTDRLSIAERLPERCVVVAHRAAAGETLLERVASHVSAELGTPVRHSWPLSRAGVLVVVGDSCVMRIAVGPAGKRLATQREVLEKLANAPAVVSERIPLPIRYGRTGLADWTVEPKAQGTPVRGDVMAPAFLEECVTFLAALYESPVDGPRRSLIVDAERCASVCPTERQRSDLMALGEELERILADVPRGFGHGDFWVENLFGEGEHLSGVIDWDGGGPGRLPLIDLIHLQVSGFRDGGQATIGDALLDSQLAAARTGGNDLTRDYCQRIGLDPDPEILEALVLAFWIDRTALELELRPDTMTPLWVQENIIVVLNHLRETGHLPRGVAPPR